MENIYKYSVSEGRGVKLSPVIKKEILSCVAKSTGGERIIKKTSLRNSKIHSLTLGIKDSNIGIPKNYERTSLYLEKEDDEAALKYFKGLIKNRIKKQEEIITAATLKVEEFKVILDNLKLRSGDENVASIVETYAKENKKFVCMFLHKIEI